MIKVFKIFIIGFIFLGLKVQSQRMMCSEELMNQMRFNLEKSLTTDSCDADCRLNLADTYVYFRKWDDAIKIVDNLFNSGNTVKATDNVLKLSYDPTKAYFIKGKAYSGKKDYTQAIAEFTKASKLWERRENIQASKEYHEIYFQRALAYDNHKSYENAIADLSFLIQMKDEDNWRWYSARAKIYEHASQKQNAAQDYFSLGKILVDYNSLAAAKIHIDDLKRLGANKEALVLATLIKNKEKMPKN